MTLFGPEFAPLLRSKHKTSSYSGPPCPPPPGDSVPPVVLSPCLEGKQLHRLNENEETRQYLVPRLSEDGPFFTRGYSPGGPPHETLCVHGQRDRRW